MRRLNMYTRDKTRAVRVGSLTLGAGNPVRVQSMTTTDPSNLEKTLPQVEALQKAGCELIRSSVLNEEQGKGLGKLKSFMKVPLIADIHFHWRLAFTAIEQGVDKIRINPGNIGKEDRVREIIRAAKANGVAMRIGVNSGSLEKEILKKYGYPTPEGFVESALRWLDICESEGYDQVVVSLKATDVQTAVRANTLFAEKCDAPLHLGITEAGEPGYGSIKSSVGLGAILLHGLGDTIRVSLTGDPVLEVPVAYDILKASGIRVLSPEVVSCPTCGRIQIEMEPIVQAIKDYVKNIPHPIRISVLGCVVNGVGEAAESDIGVAGGVGTGVIYRKGKMVRKVKEAEMLQAVKEEIDSYVRELESTNA